jgi:hypothetical protein
MKNFIIKLSIFLLPIFLYILIPVVVLNMSGENFFSIKELLQSDEKYLIGYAHNENDYLYMKWFYLNSHKKKDIWSLGSSRVLQFRENMFTDTFYNAGYTISSLNDFLPFLKSIDKSKYPNYMIIGIDQWMFNSSYDDLNVIKTEELWSNSFSFYPKVSTFFSVYRDLYNGKYNFENFKSVSSITRVGLNAYVNGKGFVSDGSMNYGNEIDKLIEVDPSLVDYEYANTYDRIESGNDRFEYGDAVNSQALLVLDDLLTFLKKNDVRVAAFLPPFADKVYDKMNKSGNYGYLANIYESIKPIFDKHGYEIYDFSTVSFCGSSDQETLDGFHGGDVTYQRLLINMLENGSVLNEVTNIDKLKVDLDNIKNYYQVYEY